MTDTAKNNTPIAAMTHDQVHEMVREAYANRVKSEGGGRKCCSAPKQQSGGGCCSSPPPAKTACCSAPPAADDGMIAATLAPSANMHRAAEKMGYSIEDVTDVPGNLGLGCGAPLTAAALQPGETVLDLGSGAGFDSFLASRIVGPTGHVIGVDMTPEMIAKAKENATKSNYNNVDFRLGQIEDLPVDSDSVDLIISNCVINLSPNKPAVFREAYRVLKPGGRLAVSDICLTRTLPKCVQDNMASYAGCIAGASLLEDYVAHLQHVGFTNISVKTKRAFDVLVNDDPNVLAALEGLDEETKEPLDADELKGSIVSATVVAFKKK